MEDMEEKRNALQIDVNLQGGSYDDEIVKVPERGIGGIAYLVTMRTKGASGTLNVINFR